MTKAFDLSWEAASTNRQLVCFRREGELLHSDTIDLHSSRARAKLATDLVAKGLDRDVVDAELMKIANELLSKRHLLEKTESPSSEIEPDRVMRPERFLLPGANGLAIPVLSHNAEGLAGSWVWYLENSGKRSKIPLAELLEVRGETIYFNPSPAQPSISAVGKWSLQSREDWLAFRPRLTLDLVFRQIQHAIDHFIEFPGERAEALRDLVGCWIVLSYSYHAWPAVPYLLVNGPLQSGKSKLFSVLRELVFRPFATDNVSAAGIFRTLHDSGGTLLFDEAERLRDTRSSDIVEVNSMLLAGYQQGRCATRIERIGDEFKPKSYDVYGPKGIACIHGVLPALQSRCIEIATQRAGKSSPKPKRAMDDVKWQSIRDHLHIAALDYGEVILRSVKNSEVCRHLNGRDYELWQPILAIAELVDAKVLERLQALSDDLCLETSELKTPEADEILLRLLGTLRRQGKFPTSTELLELAKSESSSLFGVWSPENVGRRMKAYGVRTVATGPRREFQTELQLLSEIQELYGIALGLPVLELELFP